MEFKDLIKARRLQLGKTLEEVGNAVGVSKATVQRWESGDIKNLRRDKIAALADALCTTTDYIMGWEERSPALSQERLFAITNVMPMPEMRSIPLLGSIACGEPILAEQNIDDRISIPSHIHADFALRCDGDSMIGARINDGDIVYIRQQPEVESGEIAAVLIGDEATLKRVYCSGGKIVLSPENPAYQPLVFMGDELSDVRILGKAVAFTSAL